MENLENKYTRQDLIKRIKDFDPKDPQTLSIIHIWITNESELEGINGTPKGVVFALIKEAALYFDAGYPGESLRILKTAEDYSKAKDLELLSDTDIKISVNEYGEIKTPVGLLDYFYKISKDLQSAIKDNLDYKDQ